ncbi:hypothetical protein [Psychrobacter cryohalolentis]|uniref:Uncharacterized protein n=1 Tax=Psychrobacter cryohalolentis (strain ATCC BAA-1226 / DSM 17306 / VKM B-2378 / K5) TaxID=335284 RepID=Q1QCD3_PSYCK|nr:hypothetical protein [Psychrobacter cryohalolentis]ABE74670.1 conserved hypothetical protein [Psychrobacter cryohalolentis K5]ASE27288.1 hypothetical protein CEP87_12090 [Psychrobacter cryohalolentis]
MTDDNPYNFLPLQPTGRNETDTANTYAPEDMIKIYEQQFLIPVPEEQLTEFLPALKSFYDIDNHTLDVSAIIFEAIADASIIYNHKIKAGRYQLLEGLVKEELEHDEDDKNDSGVDSNDSEEAQAYTLECKRTFFINDIEMPYYFNLFIQGDSYSTLTKQDTLLEQMYWFASDGTDDNERLGTINAQLADLGIRAMDLATLYQIVDYVEDHIIDDAMIETLNKLLDDVE